jgi:hypothetical protein
MYIPSLVPHVNVPVGSDFSFLHFRESSFFMRGQGNGGGLLKKKLIVPEWWCVMADSYHLGKMEIDPTYVNTAGVALQKH